jgi:hypothetical protein
VFLCMCQLSPISNLYCPLLHSLDTCITLCLSANSCMVYIIILHVQISLFLGFTVTKEMLTLLQTKIGACIWMHSISMRLSGWQNIKILFVVPAVFENTFECLDHMFLWLILTPCLVARFTKFRCDLILMSTPYVTCPIFVTINAYRRMCHI